MYEKECERVLELDARSILGESEELFQFACILFAYDVDTTVPRRRQKDIFFCVVAKLLLCYRTGKSFH